MTLTERDQVRYLANIVHVARADGVMSPDETSAIEEVRAAIGAKKGTLSAAQREAEAPSFALVHVDQFAARVCDVADMLFVALSDDDLAAGEREIVQEFARGVPLTDEQFEIVVREAVSRVEARGGQARCMKCAAANPSAAKFCASCGAPLRVEVGEAVSVAFEIPACGYAVEFAESSAAGFHSALELARSAPTFSSCLRAKKTWYLAAWPTAEFRSVAGLAERLAGIRNRRCYRDASEVPWEELFGFLWCSRNRQSAYKPTLYCFGHDEKRLNPWGCKVAQLEWTEWARWFSYGQWCRTGLLRGANAWRFDKERIRHELLTNVHRVRSCYHFREGLVEAVLRALPDQVEVSEKGPWKYSQAYEQVPGSIKVVEVERSGDMSLQREFWADGVRPRGLAMLEDVLEKAFAHARITDVPLSELLK